MAAQDSWDHCEGSGGAGENLSILKAVIPSWELTMFPAIFDIHSECLIGDRWDLVPRLENPVFPGPPRFPPL